MEQYSGLMSANAAGSFPAETLLQYDYAASSRSRDMEQVAVRAGVAREGECVHVRQLWCIVLDNCEPKPALAIINTDPEADYKSATDNVWANAK
jgi:hypothetical protein